MNFNNAKCSRIIRVIVISTMLVHGCLWICLLEPKGSKTRTLCTAGKSRFCYARTYSILHSRAERPHLNSFVFSWNEILGLLESSSHFEVVSVSEVGSKTYKSWKHLGAAMLCCQEIVPEMLRSVPGSWTVFRTAGRAVPGPQGQRPPRVLAHAESVFMICRPSEEWEGPAQQPLLPWPKGMETFFSTRFWLTVVTAFWDQLDWGIGWFQ